MPDGGKAEDLAYEGDDAGDGGRERVGRDGADDGDAGLALFGCVVGLVGFVDRIGGTGQSILSALVCLYLAPEAVELGAEHRLQ